MVENSTTVAVRRVSPLPAQPETFDERSIPLDVRFPQVFQKSPALTDHFQQSAARMVVFLVHAKMLGQLFDLLGQNRDLDFRRTGIRFVRAELPE